MQKFSRHSSFITVWHTNLSHQALVLLARPRIVKDPDVFQLILVVCGVKFDYQTLKGASECQDVFSQSLGEERT